MNRARAIAWGIVLFVFGQAVQAQALFEEIHTLSKTNSAAEKAFSVAAPGEYEVRLTDLGQPAPFTGLKLIVSRGTQVVATVNAPGNAVRFNTIVGTHRVHLMGSPNTAAGSGTFGVDVVPVSGGTAALQWAGAINLPAAPMNPNVSTLEAEFTVSTAGTHELQLTDFQFPAALKTLAVNVLAPGGVSALTESAAGTYTFTAAPGLYRVFVVAELNGTATSGSYGVQVKQGTQMVYSTAQVVNVQTTGGAASQPGHTFEAQLAAPGIYKVSLTDFGFPTALQSVSLNVTQNGTSLGTLSSSGSTLDVTLAAGKVYVAVIAKAASSTGNGLFGVRMAPSAGEPAVLDVTQGIGPVFDVRTVDVADAGSYRVVLADLGFPETFSQLQLAVTRGTEVIGSIFGGGALDFPATPGRYFLNFIAVPAATTQAGTYGMSVDLTPAAPTVILNANPSIVENNATTTLNWSSTDATSCTATGAWSGSKSAAGSEASSALTSSSTFKLTCTGPGGTTEKTATVNIAPAKQSGGGGGGDGVTVLALVLMFVRTIVRRSNRARVLQ